jgi:CheY-like chemotaxis protein
VRSLTGRETILYVEDEAHVRPLIARALRGFGYTVLEAADASEAIALAEANDGIDMLVTDVVMPGMNGRELADTLSARRPELKVLFTSGYPADAILRNGIADVRRAYLEKPYLPDKLAHALRAVLEVAAD